MAAAITLTDEFIKAVKPVAGKQVEYPDAKVAGLALRVSEKGKKSWTFRFRNKDGRQRRLSLGTYPAIPLVKARRSALDALGAAHDGKDPASDRREEKARAGLRQVRTVNDLAEEYFSAARLGRHRNEARPKRASTLTLEEDYFDRHLKPKFGSLPVGELLRPDFQRFLDGLGQSSPPRAARQCRNIVRQMYNFAIRREIADKNPAQFGDVPKSKSRERVLTDVEVKAIWRACESPDSVENLHLSQLMTLALRLAMVTLQRGNEICGARIGEFDFDARTWTIPGGRTKNHRTHTVPLSNAALGIVKQAMASPERPSLEDNRTPDDLPLFTMRRGPSFTRHAFTRALKRLTTALQIDDATPMTSGVPAAPT